MNIQKCKDHPQMPCDFINLNMNTKKREICFQCAQEKSIPCSELLYVNQVLVSSSNNDCQVIKNYPPLNDEQLSATLIEFNQNKILEEIEIFFTQLRKDLSKAIDFAQNKAKEAVSNCQANNHHILEEYCKMAEIEKLKQLISSHERDAETNLDEFIKDKWHQADKNREILRNLVDQQQNKRRVSLKQSYQTANQIIETIRNVDFYENYSANASCLCNDKKSIQFQPMKSTHRTSQEVELKKFGYEGFEIKNTQHGEWQQVFLDPVLDHSLKYIIHLEVNQGPRIASNYFMFGIVKDSEKNGDFAQLKKMSYYDYSSGFGIDKYIKGTPMQSGSKVAGKHSFEIRIHLDQKILKVGSLPFYSSVAQLDNPNKINPKVPYRFFISVNCLGDMMKINSISTVSEFDNKM